MPDVNGSILETPRRGWNGKNGSQETDGVENYARERGGLVPGSRLATGQEQRNEHHRIYTSDHLA